jgi:TP901 family phage tail tape measure protein
MADRDLRIRMLLEAADKVSKPLRDIAGGSTRAAQAMRATRDRLREIERAQKDIAGFRELKAGVRVASEAMRAAQTRAQALGRQIAETQNPTRALTRDFQRARDAANRLEQAHQVESRRLGELRDKLSAAGVSTTNLARHQRDLRDEAARTNTELAEQTRRLGQAADRQRRFAAARETFGRGQQVAGNMAAGGAAALGAGYAVARPLVGVVGAAQQYQSAMTDIAQKGGLSRDQAEKLGASLLVAARAANQMPADMQRGVDVLAGLGASVPDAAIMVPPIGKAATAYKAEVADLAAASYAMTSNLKVAVTDTGRSIDIMAQSGKRGAFEVKDMAAAMPALTGAYQALGQKGLSAVADLSAGLQIMRKVTGDSATAGNNMANVLQKIASPGTNKAFAKMGVDLPAALKKMYAEGKTPLEALAELTNKTLKGDLSKLGYLFEDSQVQQGLRPLITNLEEFKRIRAEAAAANGTTDVDFAERMKDSAEQTRALKANAAVLAVTLGTQLLPTVNKVVTKATALANRFGAWAQRHPMLTKALLLTAGVIGVLLFVFGALAIAMAAIMGPFILLNAGLVAMGVAGGIASAGLLPILGTIALVVGAIVLLAGLAYLIYNNWGELGAWFSALWGRVKAIFVGAWQAIKAAFNGGLSGVLALLGSWIAQLWRWGMAAFVALGRIGAMLMPYLWNALKGGVSWAIAAAPGLLSGFIGAIRSAVWNGLLLLPRMAVQFGVNTVRGFINGMLGLLPSVGKTIGRIADATIGWFKNKLGIRSPSRVFAGLGGYMMQGLSNGIAGGASGPIGRVDQLSKRLTRAVATGAAASMTLSSAAAAPGAIAAGGGTGMAGARSGPVYNITVNGAGQDPEAIARAVAAEIDRRENRVGSVARSSLSDRQDDWS